MTSQKITQNRQTPALAKLNRFERNLPKAQEVIYNFLLDIVKDWSPEDVLNEFKHLFLHHSNTISSNTLPCLYEIVFSNQEQEFRNTLKRSCYILINNWELKRNHAAIQDLIRLFDDPIIYRHTVSPSLQRLRIWLRKFVESQDFEDLKLFATRYEQELTHWSERYTSYLLVPQYVDLTNPLEQRQAARALSQKLKEEFKFRLAMYTAKTQSPTSPHNLTTNPTGLGDEVLRLVKLIVARRGFFSYANLANIFLRQTQTLTYGEFKQSLQKYLTFSLESNDVSQILEIQLREKLGQLYANHNDRTIDNALLLRTCNRIIDMLTIDSSHEPSQLFVLMLSKGSPLILVIALLKLILICRNARTHLESRIAALILHYQELSEEDCQWVINFFEVFRVTMAIYAENIRFNLVSMKGCYGDRTTSTRLAITELDDYRIFSQPVVVDPADETLEAMERSLIEALSENIDDTTSTINLPV